MKTSLSLVLAGASLLNTGVFAQTSKDADAIPLPRDAQLPSWPKPILINTATGAITLRSGDLELTHSEHSFGGFLLRVTGRTMAAGQNRPMAAYVGAGQLKWVDLAEAPERKLSVRGQPNLLSVTFACADPDGAHWSFNQEFRPGPVPGSINLEITISLDQDRAVAFLPMLMIFPGLGSFGQSKGQGLLTGLEYLENEPSSSEADVLGPASKRQVPDSLKLTFPLMAVQSDDRYVALTWQMRPHLCALYDSPDRTFGSGAHVMGVLFPGSNGADRQEGNLLPRAAQIIRAGGTLVFHATFLGGRGKSVVPPLQQYAAMRPLPPVPNSLQLPDYISLTIGGWLDSKIREGNLVRHAILGGNFPPGQAADAGMWMDWLGDHSTDSALNARLHETASNVLAAVNPPDLNVAGVGHVRFPVASLIYGHVEQNAGRAAERARALLAAFEPDGSLKYHPRPDGPDYGKTHYTNEANGLTSRSVLDCLEAASFCGDPELLRAALQKLRAMDKFRHSVPRGAQTWECPLHTPDILASAQLVRAYTLGYELTAESDFLEQARYWAWTGVPFVYLVSPTDRHIGLYSTIAVFGATQWQAPVWMGLPVQWCGLVYADALYRLVRHDPKGPWKRLADGITASGIQQSWPASNRDTQGLLPDSFVLRTQNRNGPAINPATVQACAVRFFNQIPVYDFWCFPKNKLLVHAPGEIARPQEKSGRLNFQVNPAFGRPCFVLINGLKHEPRLKLNGKEMPCTAPHLFEANQGQLILQIEGESEVELSLP
jgi:hypothetical protein